jgi:hypothetical protein
MILLGYAYVSVQYCWQVLFRRFEIIGLLYLFVTMHCFLDIKSMYDFIYRHRVIIAIVLFVFMVANCFTLSSVSVYDACIQPNHSCPYCEPIFGTAREIRSDEWLVNLSRIISGSYSRYGSENSVVRGVASSGISATGGYYFDYSALRSVSSLGYYFLDVSYGNSFAWNFQMIFGALLAFELFMIVTKGKKLYSLLGCVLLWFSSFNMWWSICYLLLPAIAIVVFFYYMIKSVNWKKRLLFGILLALSGADFCTNLYPAWQVPFGWVILSLMVWILIDNKEWKDYRPADWTVITVCILFMGSIIGRFLQVDSSYIQAVTATVYPGMRENYGGYSLYKLLGYGAGMINPFVEIGNAPEIGTFFAVFPLGIILAGHILKKEKWKNNLIWCLSVPTAVLLLYCAVGLPSFLAKALMLSYSTPIRAVDALGISATILLIVSLSEMEVCGKMHKAWALLFSSISCVWAVISCLNIYSTKSMILICIIELATAAVIYILLHEDQSKLKRWTIISISFVLLADGIIVNPITVGLSAITEKPLYQKVRTILSQNQEHTRWIGLDNRINANYLIACGAPTMNSTNYIPNEELWNVLDSNHSKEELWNRYAHILITLSNEKQTEVNLTYADEIDIELCADDFQRLNVNYVLGSQESIPDSYKNILEKIYDEDGSILYRVKSKK